MSVEELFRQALTDISEAIPCGCMPCMGYCRSKDSLELEVEWRQEAASKVLAKAKTMSAERPAPEPVDRISAITRDIARSA